MNNKTKYKHVCQVEICAQKVEVFLSPRLHGDNGKEVNGLWNGNNLFINSKIKRAAMVDALTAFVSYRWCNAYGVKSEWGYGLSVGQRKVPVKLVRVGTEPYRWRIRPDLSLVTIETASMTNCLIPRVIEAADRYWQRWVRRTIKRGIKRQKPALDLPEPEKPQPTRKRRKRVKAGEPLPAAEKDALAADLADVQRKLEQAADAPDPKQETDHG